MPTSSPNVIDATASRIRAHVSCPNCQSPVDVRCSTPTDHGRRFVDWVHSTRWDKYDETERRAHLEHH